jgi:NAD+ kinase
MDKPGMSIQRVVIAAHPRISDGAGEAAKIASFLEERGISSAHGLLYDESLRRRIIARKFDLLIALGGDGTMLRAGHLCGPLGIPILGINLGHFGFLMEIKDEEWREALPRLLAGDFWLEKHMMLNAEHWRGEELLGTWEVLNEIVVSRGQIVRPVHLVTHVDNFYLTTYVADALIASTPTGSTAYALAAGGPILPPEVRNILLVAAAPHLSLDRAIVLAEGSSVAITVHTDHHAVLSPDGQVPVGMADGDRVVVNASEHTVQFVRFQDPGYFYRNLIALMDQNPSTGIKR